MKFDSNRLAWLYIIAPMLIFVVLRLPPILHMPGGQDEQFFAVPGYTVLKSGVPRIPYLPTRTRSSLFENSDKCMMALPPALFYLQAPFFAIFPAGYPTARLPLLLGALVAIGICYGVARSMGASPLCSGFAALVFSICRPLLFTGMNARPDLWCAVFGWLTILCLWRYSHRRTWPFMMLAGACCGLAALFHPYALVFLIQSIVAMLAFSGVWFDRIKRLAIFGLACGSAVSLWLPLIAMFPYEFRSQFFANVLDRAGPSLPNRIVWPFASFSRHAVLVYEFAGPIQMAAVAAILVIGSIVCFRRMPWRAAIGYVALMWSSIYLTAVVAGVHPTKGYWVYPWLWILASFGLILQACFRFAPEDTSNTELQPGASKLAIAIGCLLMLFTFGSHLPGAGLKSAYLYTRHWGDPRFHARHFIANVLQEMPQEGLFLADAGYIFDIYLSGRETLLCTDRYNVWGDRQFDYTALMISLDGEDTHCGQVYDGQLVKKFGGRDSPQECFVNYYRQANKPNVENSLASPTSATPSSQ